MSCEFLCRWRGSQYCWCIQSGGALSVSLALLFCNFAGAAHQRSSSGLALDLLGAIPERQFESATLLEVAGPVLWAPVEPLGSIFEDTDSTKEVDETTSDFNSKRVSLTIGSDSVLRVAPDATRDNPSGQQSQLMRRESDERLVDRTKFSSGRDTDNYEGEISVLSNTPAPDPNNRYIQKSHGKACGISGGHFHERCQCPQDKLPFCRDRCDEDSNCKGYVAAWAPVFAGCQFATVSKCPAQCSKHDLGNVGPLTQGLGTDYGGCYVKTGPWAETAAVTVARGVRCSSFDTCGEGRVPDPKTQHVLCEGGTCSPELCCKQLAICSDISGAECSSESNITGAAALVPDPAKARLPCPDGKCSPQFCCKASPTCSSFEASGCGENFVVDPNKTQDSCTSGACTRDMCCKEGPKCASYSCGSAHAVNSSRIDRYCPGGSCTLEFCCFAAPKCGHFTKCGKSHIPDHAKKDAHCPTGNCTASICCRPASHNHTSSNTTTTDVKRHKKMKVKHLLVVVSGIAGVFLIAGICVYAQALKKRSGTKGPQSKKLNRQASAAPAVEAPPPPSAQFEGSDVGSNDDS